MPSYLTHAMEGRARLRHPALAASAGRDRALAALSGAEGVLEARPGVGSILLILAPGADLGRICGILENALPALRQAGRASADVPALAPLSFLSGFSHGKTRLKGLSPRKLEARALLAACGLSIALGFAGGKNAHALAGTVFGLLAARHVWTRRKAL
ncbi:hypothetical protein [Desulfovibrio sp. SGI.169]|uniref:hypothetical protein n=1 Tax=Desulfovibrio sp. SGI.169 TaxID=3420561 RepID=UPI003D0069F7